MFGGLPRNGTAREEQWAFGGQMWPSCRQAALHEGQGLAKKGVHDADGAIQPIVLKILGQEFRQAIVLRVCP